MGRVIQRTNPAGSVVFGIRWTDALGRDRKRFSRSWSREDASAALARVEATAAHGELPDKAMTINDLFAEWHRNHVSVHCSPAWQKDTASQFRLRIRGPLGDRMIDTITRRHVSALLAAMKAEMRREHPDNEYAGHRSINKALTVLKGMLSYAVAAQLLERNPAHGISELEEQPQRPIDAWPVAAIHEVALAARDLPDRLPAFQRSQQAAWIGERDYTLIMLAATTGLRQSELLGLHWEQIDKDWIHVTHKLCRTSHSRRETKSKRGHRRVPLLDRSRALLSAWKDHSAHPHIVFSNQSSGGYQRAEHFSNDAWTKARREVGRIDLDGKSYDCRRLTFHELRHTFVSLALSAGRDLWEVAHWAGDDPDVIKRVYGHYIPDSLGDTRRLNATFDLPCNSSGANPGGIAEADQ